MWRRSKHCLNNLPYLFMLENFINSIIISVLHEFECCGKLQAHTWNMSRLLDDNTMLKLVAFIFYLNVPCCCNMSHGKRRCILCLSTRLAERVKMTTNLKGVEKKYFIVLRQMGRYMIQAPEIHNFEENHTECGVITISRSSMAGYELWEYHQLQR